MCSASGVLSLLCLLNLFCACSLFPYLLSIFPIHNHKESENLCACYVFFLVFSIVVGVKGFCILISEHHGMF